MMPFDPDMVKRYCVYNRDGIYTPDGIFVNTNDYDALLTLYKLIHRALMLSIARRKVGQNFENVCAELEYWLTMAHIEIDEYKKNPTD